MLMDARSVTCSFMVCCSQIPGLDFMVMTYLVDIHSHTIASTHAYSTIHDYIAEAKRKGIRLFATTDHGPDMADAPHPWHFTNLCVLPRIVDGVGILRGIEANIKNLFGEIDVTERMLSSLDIVLAGFHEPVFPPKDMDSHTRAMVNAIRSGKVDIITHPGNTAFPIDIETVVRCAVECNVALEVNDSSFNYSRKGCEANCRAIIETAKSLGATLAIGSDAHIAFNLGEFSTAAQMIRYIGFPEERLLNSSPQKLLNFLEQRGHAPIAEFATL
jgi:putative hydrolase